MTNSSQRTRIHTADDRGYLWEQLVEELARRGVLGAVGAADAFLSISPELAAERIMGISSGTARSAARS